MTIDRVACVVLAAGAGTRFAAAATAPSATPSTAASSSTATPPTTASPSTATPPTTASPSTATPPTTASSSAATPPTAASADMGAPSWRRRPAGPGGAAIKLLATVGGETVLGTVLANVRAVPALRPVVCVLGAHADAIRATVAFDGVEVVVADDWADGQSASLRAGVAAVRRAWDSDAQRVGIPRSRHAESVLVVLGDQPGITPQVLAGTLDHDDPERHDAVRPTYDGVPGNPVLLGPRVLEQVPGLTGDQGARELLRTARVEHWEAGHLADPTDIDTPDSLEAFAP